MSGTYLRGGNSFAFLLFFDFFYDALGSFRLSPEISFKVANWIKSADHLAAISARVITSIILLRRNTGELKSQQSPLKATKNVGGIGSY